MCRKDSARQISVWIHYGLQNIETLDFLGIQHAASDPLSWAGIEQHLEDGTHIEHRDWHFQLLLPNWIFCHNNEFILWGYELSSGKITDSKLWSNILPFAYSCAHKFTDPGWIYEMLASFWKKWLIIQKTFLLCRSRGQVKPFLIT